jgi:hypothetical protein
MKPYKGQPDQHGMADYNSWTTLPMSAIPGGVEIVAGKDNYAQMVHVVNSQPVELSGDVTVVSESEQAPGDVANTFISQMGGIAEATTPIAVDDGDAVAIWLDILGRQIIKGYNNSLSAIDVHEIDPATQQRLGPVYNLGSESASVTADTTGATLSVSGYHNFTIHMIVTNVSLGATIEIQSSMNDNDWVIITTEEIVNNDNIEIAITDTVYPYIRTRIRDYVDGQYKTIIFAGN